MTYDQWKTTEPDSEERCYADVALRCDCSRCQENEPTDEVERCSSCELPAHASETTDDGVCGACLEKATKR